jgi:mevalonate kinase
MTGSSATAPGKVILFGEHAVVYGQPALAVPVHDLQATASVRSAPAGSGIVIQARDLGIQLSLAEAATNALAKTAQLVLDRLEAAEPDVQITVQSTIPIAGGLGSGAAVSAALARALADYLGQPLEDDTLSALVYEVEKLHHGTPSGIDNTVICHAKPVYFVRDRALEIFHVARPFHLLIADTGVTSPTRIAVGAVREAWTREPDRYNRLFGQIGEIAEAARRAIESGAVERLGPLMTENQARLREMDVSSPELERLIEAAMQAGAGGAKLSGGGRGGNMIALVAPEQAPHTGEALREAGATRVMHTVVR